MKNNSKSNNLLLWIVLIGVFWIKASSLLSMPFLTIFLYKNTHLSLVHIGIIVGFQPLALCFGSIFGGYLSDILKRQHIILLSVFIGALVFLGFYISAKYLSSNIQIISFGALNLINGFSSALFSPTSRAIISDISKSPQDSIKYLHLRYLALNLGAALGPLLGAYAGIAANTEAFLITGVLYLIYACILLIILNKYLSKSVKIETTNVLSYSFFAAIKYLVNNYLFLSLLFSLIVFNIIYIQLTSNYALIISKNIVNGTIFFSWLLSLNAISVVILQPVIFRFIKNKNQKLLIPYGYLILLVGGLLIAFLSVNKFTLILFVICLSVAEILIFPTGSILVSSFTIEKYRGTAFGAIDLEYLGCALGPALGSYILQLFNLNGYLYFVASLPLISIMLYLPCILNSKNNIN